MIRFLHLSDIHLSAGFANKSSYVRNQIKEALYESIVRAIDYTIENDLEGLILAGDFFDDDKLSFKDEYFVINQFERLLNNRQKIFYATGNHDPMLTARFLEPLKGQSLFHFFEDDTIKCLDVVSRSGIPYKVVGVGHKSKNEQRNLIMHFPVKSTDEIWLGLAHASVPSAIDIDDKARYMATPLIQIEALDYNYFALGHIHIRQKLTPKIAYSGNLQGLNIKETGTKGGFLVTLAADSTTVEPVDFNVIYWEQCDLLLTPDIKTLSELQQRLVDQITVSIADSPSAAKLMIMRMNLCGRSPLKKQLEQDSNRTFLAEIVKDKTGLLDFEIKSRNLNNYYNLDELSRENTLLSQMIKRISSESFEDDLLTKIYELPIFDDTFEKDKYLESMKNQLLQDVVERMVVCSDDH
jgi:DNA repair exonuclease SbcCD nuclease subunit